MHTLAGSCVVRSSKGDIAYCAQRPCFLADSTIRDNIVFGERDDAIDAEALRTALDGSGLLNDMEDEHSSLHDKRELTAVGPQGQALSGGQRAGVNLARAIYALHAHDVDTILLDDPIPALDNKNKQLVWTRGVKSALQGATRIIVMNSQLVSEFGRDADMLVLLAAGKIAYAGAPGALPTSLVSQIGEEYRISTPSGTTAPKAAAALLVKGKKASLRAKFKSAVFKIEQKSHGEPAMLTAARFALAHGHAVHDDVPPPPCFGYHSSSYEPVDAEAEHGEIIRSAKNSHKPSAAENKPTEQIPGVESIKALKLVQKKEEKTAADTKKQTPTAQLVYLVLKAMGIPIFLRLMFEFGTSATDPAFLAWNSAWATDEYGYTQRLYYAIAAGIVSTKMAMIIAMEVSQAYANVNLAKYVWTRIEQRMDSLSLTCEPPCHGRGGGVVVVVETHVRPHPASQTFGGSTASRARCATTQTATRTSSHRWRIYQCLRLEFSSRAPPS